MDQRTTPTPPATEGKTRERGSALVLALFVLVLLSLTGTALLFNSMGEQRMGQASMQSKEAFYLAEAGIEAGRSLLFTANGNGPFSDDLAFATNGDGVLGFDPAQITVARDADGRPVALDSMGGDRPLVALTQAGGGIYAAFLTNDPSEYPTNSISNQTDGDNRVMITGVGAAADGSFEVTQAIIELERIFPSFPQATITLLGPTPNFQGATSDPKIYNGADCVGSALAPVVGTVGPVAEASAEAGIFPNPDYDSGPYSDEDTFSDLNDTSDPLVAQPIDPLWTNCAALHDMVEDVRLVADVVCTPPAACVLPPVSPRRIVFVDGDYAVGPADDGEGLLLVTGELSFHGKASWKGLIYVIGEGRFVRSGSGNGTISGASIVADIAGPDDIYGTADDCSGGDGGFDVVTYDERGGGNSTTSFCSADFVGVDPVKPYAVKAFLQR